MAPAVAATAADLAAEAIAIEALEEVDLGEPEAPQPPPPPPVREQPPAEPAEEIVELVPDDEPSEPGSPSPPIGESAAVLPPAPSTLRTQGADPPAADGATASAEEAPPSTEDARVTIPKFAQPDSKSFDPPLPPPQPLPRRPGGAVVADASSVTVIRPIEISSDLPPVEPRAPAPPPTPAPAASVPATPPPPPPLTHRRPPPPSKAPEPLDEVLEVEGELVAEPAAEVGAPSAPYGAGPAGAATAEPEPTELAVDAIEEIEPDRMSLPAGDESLALEVRLGELPTVGPDGDPRSPLSKRAPPPPRRGLPTPVIDVEIEDPDGGGAAAPSVDESAPPHVSQPPVAGAPATPPPISTPRPTSIREPEPETRPEPKKPWWAELFDEDFSRTLDRLQPHQREREAAFLDQCLGLEQGARIMDLGCGEGLLTVDLAKRGYDMVGVDRSAAMLGLAAKHAQTAAAQVSFVQGDMRQLDLDAVFDGIYCWHASFGYFSDDENADVLARVHRALRRGGMFLLDVTNRDFIVGRQPSMAWFSGRDCVCMDEMKLDFYSSRMSVKRMIMFRTGKSREVEYSIRIYALHELGKLLHDAGFKVVEVSGHIAHRGAYFGFESPRIIILAERS